MPFEIERKFLPKDPDWRPTGPCHVLRQGFFWLDEDSAARVKALSLCCLKRTPSRWAT